LRSPPVCERIASFFESVSRRCILCFVKQPVVACACETCRSCGQGKSLGHCGQKRLQTRGCPIRKHISCPSSTQPAQDSPQRSYAAFRGSFGEHCGLAAPVRATTWARDTAFRVQPQPLALLIVLPYSFADSSAPQVHTGH
jgi:hypothetical protein